MRVRLLMLMTCIAMVLGGLVVVRPSGAQEGRREEYVQILQSLVQRQDTATMRGDVKALPGLYWTEEDGGRTALQNATDRLLYIKDWAKARAIRFERVVVHVRADALTVRSPSRVSIIAADSARYEYRHEVGDTKPAWFGLGVYHRYVIHKSGGRWYIAQDHFIDPLNQDTRLGGAAHPARVRVPDRERRQGPDNAAAARALRYAGQYCGAAPGCGHDNRYNPAYANYVWSGGDCTNFISQILRAGGFPETARWHWDQARDEGTSAWVNAPHLVGYLEMTHRVSLIAQGPMPVLLKAAAGGIPLLARLRPGDIIAYVERGRVVHLAVVVGYDPDGYPVVDSHSADRFREPWDLGWDRTTRYLLLDVHYPDPPEPTSTRP